jgi:hypothetical protein
VLPILAVGILSAIVFAGSTGVGLMTLRRDF